MDDNKKIVYSEPTDCFPEEIRKKYKIGEYSEKDTLKDCGGIEPIPMIDETKSVSDERKAEIKRRLQGRAAEYLMFLDD